MKTYKAHLRSPNENMIVDELNASIATGTFPRETFISKPASLQKADLYSRIDGCDVLVGHRSCPPVNAEFKKTVKVSFEQI